VSRPLYRATRRVATLRRAIFAFGALVIGYLPKIPDVFKFLEWAKDNSVKAIPFLRAVWSFILSAYFAPALMVGTVLILFWQAWPVSTSARAESFIEMLEDRIKLGRALIKCSSDVTLFDWKTWEQKTFLDLTRFLGVGNELLDLFQSEGQFTTHEYEMGAEAPKRALRRQIRNLKELIDRTDQGKLRSEAEPARQPS
jgi:hypothetical protein